jgi:membrane fusion protein (multidrug efflux system)
MIEREIIGFVLILAASSCGKSPTGTTEEAGRPLEPIAVDASRAVVERIDISLDAVGSLEAAEDVLISAEVAGRVEEICFEEGMTVERGTVLVRIDGETIRLEREQSQKRLERMKAGLQRMEAEIRRAQAQAENAKSNFDRKQELYDQGATTKATYLDAKTTYDSSLAQLDEAEAALEETKRSIVESEAGLKIVEKRLDDTAVKAPFDGILGERFVGPGDYVDVAGGLVRLVAVDPLKAWFTVPERYRGRILLDQEVSLAVEAWPGRSFKGKVIYIAPSLDTETRSVKVKAVVDNEEGLLQPGFFVSVRLILNVKPEAVVIPEEAVIPRGDRFFLYKVKEEKASLAEIELGQRLAGKVEVLDGIEVGETVITAGHQRVTDGYPVRIRKQVGS